MQLGKYNTSVKGDKYIIFRVYTPHHLILRSGISYCINHIDTRTENLRKKIESIKTEVGSGKKRILQIIDASEGAAFADELKLLDSYTIEMTELAKKMAGKNMPFFKVRRYDRKLMKNVRDGLKEIRQRYAT